DRQGRRNPANLKDGVAVADSIVIEWHSRRPIRRRAGGDQDESPLQGFLLPSIGHCDLGWRQEAGPTLIAVDVVPAKVVLDPLPFLLQDELLAEHEVIDGDALHGHFDCVRESPLTEAGEVQRRFAESLGRNRTRVHARAAWHRIALDERHAFAEVRGLSRPLLAGGTGADDDQIVHVLNIGSANAQTSRSVSCGHPETLVRCPRLHRSVSPRNRGPEPTRRRPYLPWPGHRR